MPPRDPAETSAPAEREAGADRVARWRDIIRRVDGQTIERAITLLRGRAGGGQAVRGG